MSKPWIAFFSQTGGEIADLSEQLGRWPDLIVTNRRPAHLRTIDPRILERQHDLLTVTVNKPSVEVYKSLIYDKDAIVTLHGWLRIMPKEICEEYSIINGHPGLITEYPELKGKDPQVRAFEGKYKTAGCVLHRVIPEVDEGQIISEESFNAEGLSLDELFRILKDRSLYLWINFLEKVL